MTMKVGGTPIRVKVVEEADGVRCYLLKVSDVVVPDNYSIRGLSTSLRSRGFSYSTLSRMHLYVCLWQQTDVGRIAKEALTTAPAVIIHRTPFMPLPLAA